MVELPFTSSQVSRARKKAEKLGSLYNSITKGKGNLAGYLGEIVTAKYIEGKLISCNKGSDKFKFDLKWNGKTIECKTKRRSVDPLPEYDASIADASTHQTPDIYAFLSITIDKKTKKIKKVWLCGFITKEDFFNKAEFIKRNTWDKSNGFRCKQDMWNLPYSELAQDINLLDI